VTDQPSEANELRALVACLLISITGSLPDGSVLSDLDQLRAAADEAGQLAAATKHERDEFKASVTELCRQRDERKAEFETLLAEDELHRERLRQLGPIVSVLTEGDPLGELAKLRAKVAAYEAGAAFTVHGGDRISSAQMWRMLLDASAESRLNTLDAMVENGWNAKRCQDEGHADRPAREAFDEVCRSVELQRQALVDALGGDQPEQRLSFADAVKLVWKLEQLRKKGASDAEWSARWRLMQILGTKNVSVTWDDLLDQVDEVHACASRDQQRYQELAAAVGVNPSTAPWGSASWDALIERVNKLYRGAP
jgi:hypothetical protein